MHKQMFFNATIQLVGIDRIGLLNEVTQVISRQLNVNIRKVVISCENDIFDGKIELRVHDRDDVKVIMDELKSVNGIQEIQQVV
jgi:GTP pyrophosphokinase